MQGELTVVVEGAGAPEAGLAIDDATMHEHLGELIHAGVQPSQAAKLVSKLLNVPKGRVYDAAMQIAGRQA